MNYIMYSESIMTHSSGKLYINRPNGKTVHGKPLQRPDQKKEISGSSEENRRLLNYFLKQQDLADKEYGIDHNGYHEQTTDTVGNVL